MSEPTASENPFSEIPGVSPEDAEELAQLSKESYQEFKNSEEDDYSLLVGLRALGAPKEAVDAAIGLGANLVTQGLLDKADEYFAGLAQLEPLNWKVLTWLGYIQQLRKNFSTALEWYTMAMGYAPDEPLVRFYIGETILVMERPDIAIVHLKYGIERAAGNPKFAAHVKRATQLIAAAEDRMKAATEAKPDGK